MIGLTPRQKDCVNFLRAYRDEHGVMPSCSEIADGIGVKAKSQAKYLIDELVTRGVVRRLSHRARAIELIEPEVRAVLLSREIYGLLSAYAAGMGIGVDTAAGELLRQSLGAA